MGAPLNDPFYFGISQGLFTIFYHPASLGILHLWKPPSITVRLQHFQSTPPLAELAADPVLARMADPTGPSFVKASLGGFQSHGAAWPIS